MAALSLPINLLVLFPVCIGLVEDSVWTQERHGPTSAARSILLSICMSIAAASLWLPVWPDSTRITVRVGMQIH